MSQRIQVRNGTPREDSKILCLTCKYAHRTEASTGTVRLTCVAHELSIEIRHKIVKCSDYSERGKPSLWHFEQLAWTLQTDRNRGPIGFEPPKKRDYL